MVDGYGNVDDFAVVATNFPLDGDFGTIQDAIDAGACGIYVKGGTYVMTGSVTVPDGVHIFGESRQGVVLNFGGNAWNIVVNGDNVEIEGLRVIGSGSALAAFYYNVAENSRVKNCTVQSSVRAAAFAGSTYCHFEDNKCQGISGEAVFVDATSTDNRIHNNRVTDGLHYGVFLEGAFNKVVNNTFAGHMFDGILVASKMNTIHGNTCNNNANGIYVAKENGDNNSIVGNTCYQNLGYGININSLENAGNVATGNMCRDNGVADIRFVPGNTVETNDANTIV